MITGPRHFATTYFLLLDKGCIIFYDGFTKAWPWQTETYEKQARCKSPVVRERMLQRLSKIHTGTQISLFQDKFSASAQQETGSHPGISTLTCSWSRWVLPHTIFLHSSLTILIRLCDCLVGNTSISGAEALATAVHSNDTFIQSRMAGNSQVRHVNKYQNMSTILHSHVTPLSYSISTERSNIWSPTKFKFFKKRAGRRNSWGWLAKMCKHRF